MKSILSFLEQFLNCTQYGYRANTGVLSFIKLSTLHCLNWQTCLYEESKDPLGKGLFLLSYPPLHPQKSGILKRGRSGFFWIYPDRMFTVPQTGTSLLEVNIRWVFSSVGRAGSGRKLPKLRCAGSSPARPTVLLFGVSNAGVAE